jgi:hypothetical protein
MKKVSINRLKAKVRQYKMQQSKAQSNMIEGNVNDYIKDLINLYRSKNELPLTLIPIENKR